MRFSELLLVIACFFPTYFGLPAGASVSPSSPAARMKAPVERVAGKIRSKNAPALPPLCKWTAVWTRIFFMENP
jgi:hypothetical protein